MTRRAAGFTLIEVAVALALAALVGLIVLQGLRFTASAYERVARHADRLDDRTSLEALLRRALATAAPESFQGGPDRLSFVTVADDGGAGLYRVELGTVDGEIVLTRRLAAPFGDPQVQRSVVSARGLRLAYFGAAGPADAPAWRERWEAIARPPQLVRIILDTPGDDPRPPLVVRLWSAG